MFPPETERWSREDEFGIDRAWEKQKRFSVADFPFFVVGHPLLSFSRGKTLGIGGGIVLDILLGVHRPPASLI